ncbi:hypothetical protein GQ43DRAFT_225354 [Delitschia confertaspora ATCC 74209]|uniref:Uncharacterized protein n=1 Tax=Delitschia confertaspora ATCC 74209 TaxID=1513339 RepID=A0A9P4JRA9_9PLEO|nr:hypothetical protein GQ43DRAFT_225354 [Delitschia confertaspora ATCC 74209]
MSSVSRTLTTCPDICMAALPNELISLYISSHCLHGRANVYPRFRYLVAKVVGFPSFPCLNSIVSPSLHETISFPSLSFKMHFTLQLIAPKDQSLLHCNSRDCASTPISNSPCQMSREDSPAPPPQPPPSPVGWPMATSDDGDFIYTDLAALSPLNCLN